MAKRSLRERAEGKYEVDPSGCWLWTAALNRHGYGILDGRYAHRVLYKALVGEVPDDLHLDHLCRVRNCVNPAHLEPVTPRVNVMRSTAVTATNAAKTHCKRGHPFDQRNTYVKPTGYRGCRTCHADTERARRAARKR
jgi:hypothetical protein